jgi:hypothetical protein
MTGSGKGDFAPSTALWRLMLVVGVGAALVVLYGVRSVQSGVATFLATAGVGLLASGAALVSGGLLGFLFGIPHARSDGGSSDSGGGSQSIGANPLEPRNQQNSPGYRANTSLEQISDWLTKILVGVGLVQIKEIPGRVQTLASYIARGLGGGDQAEAMALAILVYFSTCGFVFGFLWARIYLIRWFSEADHLQALEDKVSRLEQRQKADAKALGLMQQVLNPTDEGSPVAENDLNGSVATASVPVRAQIFSQAELALSQRRSIEGASRIFRALILSDTEEQYHRNHFELSKALRQMAPPKLEEAIKELTKAIQIRDKLRVQGWKYYEFLRARCRIDLIPNADVGRPSPPELTALITADLRAARAQKDKWLTWYTTNGKEQQWVSTNSAVID